MQLISGRLRLAGFVILTAVLTACTEKLDSSAGCPILCPGQGGEIETVTIDAVTLDSTVSALTGQGTEASLLVATRGDSLDARAVLRFDSIPGRYRLPGADTTSIPVTTADSVILRMRVDTVDGKIPASMTLDLYDVDSDAPDSAVNEIAALFTPGRLIASATFEKAALKDTILVTLPSAAILSRLDRRLRIGIRARGPESVQLRILSQEGAGIPTLLSYRVSPDTTVARVSLTPESRTPADQPALAFSLADYTLLVRGTATGPATGLNVGGLPARRVYMRFDIPSFLIDSVDVVRATLLLTQISNPGIDQTDTVRIVPFVGLATTAVGDVAKAAQITALASSDTLRVTPGSSGVSGVEIAAILSLWRATNAAETPRAIVLISAQEGNSPLEARFFSAEAAPEFRPRLRISYSTRKSTGLP
ncbi:MAG: hypothetical protein ACSLFK_15665 [Gemmatimonadaceae bacterium]